MYLHVHICVLHPTFLSVTLFLLYSIRHHSLHRLFLFKSVCVVFAVRGEQPPNKHLMNINSRRTHTETSAFYIQTSH